MTERLLVAVCTEPFLLTPNNSKVMVLATSASREALCYKSLHHWETETVSTCLRTEQLLLMPLIAVMSSARRAAVLMSIHGEAKCRTAKLLTLSTSSHACYLYSFCMQLDPGNSSHTHFAAASRDCCLQFLSFLCLRTNTTQKRAITTSYSGMVRS